MHNKVGLGTFPLAGVFKPISIKEAENIVKKFIDEGGYYLDTAPLYGNGDVEKLLGRVLKSVPRDKFYLGTKTIKHVDKNGKLFKSGKYKDVINQIDNSLSRLQMDYVDQLMIHSPDANTPIEETLRALEELQKAGKVRELAVSNVNLEELKKYNQTGKIKFVQNRFSLINRSLSSELESYLLDNQISLIPWHLLEVGQLTGIAFENYKLRKGDFREQFPYWNQENQAVVFEWVRSHLNPIAERLGTTIGQLNIAWGLNQKYIDFVVVGTTNPKYLKINLEANNIKLDKETLQEVDKAYVALIDNVQSKFNQPIKEFRGLNDKFY